MIPPRRILAATDFSTAAETALAFAAHLARHAGAELHVMHAEDRVLHLAAQVRGVDLIQETRDALADAVARRAAGCGHVRQHVVLEPAAPAICDVARRERADLIVIGMHGMSGTQRLLFGSTTHAVLRRADVSILVVPHTWRPPAGAEDLSGTGPVVAAVEPSQPALAATAAASRLAQLLHTSLEIVHVVAKMPVLERWQPYAHEAAAARAEAAGRELDTMLRGVVGALAGRLRVEIGSVPECLAEAAADSESRHPLLVLGRGNARGDAPGTTACRVLPLVRVPVLVYSCS